MNCLVKIYRDTKIEHVPHLMLLLIAVFIATLSTFVVYPGVMHADCYVRAECAKYIIDGTWPEGFTPYVTLLPAVFTAIPLWLTGNLGTYIWLQAIFFLWSLFEFLCEACKNYILVLVAFLALSPLFVGYAVFWDSRVLAAILLVWMLVIDKKMNKKNENIILVLTAVGYFLVAFVITGYVINAATAIVGLLIWNAGKMVMHREEAKIFFIKVASSVLGILLALQVPLFLGLPQGSNATTGMLWEMGCVVNRIGLGNGYDRYLDEIIGEGETAKIFEAENPEAESVWAFQIDYNTAAKEKTGDISRKYIQLIQEKPIEFIRTKLAIAREVLTRADFNAYHENQEGRMQEFGMQESTRRTQAIRIVNAYMKACVVFRIPILMFAIAGVLILMAKVAKINVEQSVKTLWVAITYQCGFFLTTQAYVFRYYFPAFLLTIFVILKLVSAFIDIIWNKRISTHSCYIRNMR